MKYKKILIPVVLFAAFVCAVLLYLYSLRVNFIGEIKWFPAAAVRNIQLTSPFGNRTDHMPGHKNPQGYFREIAFTTKDSAAIPLIYQYFGRDSIRLTCFGVSENRYSLNNPRLSFLQKSKAVIYFNINVIANLLMALLFLSMVAVNAKRIYVSAKKLLQKVPHHFSFLRGWIRDSKRALWISAVIAMALYPLLFLAGVNFSDLYNIPHAALYPIVTIIFFIPLLGFFQRNRASSTPYGFFAFWFIFFIHFFIVSPQIFSGNYGFHGYFSDFLNVPVHKSFLAGLVTPDTGYYALLPRLVYAIASWFSPDASQSIAIVSLFSLIIYSLLSGFLAGRVSKFLWPTPAAGFIFVVIIAVFPVFSMVPGNQFPMSITDTAYYGIIFSFVILFIITENKTGTVYIMTLVNCLLILSKAHFISLFPLYAIALIIFIRYKKKNGIILSGYSLMAIMIQAIICFFSSLQMQMAHSSNVTFTMNLLSFKEQVVVAAVYFLKSYVHIFVPFAGKSGPAAYLLPGLMIIVIILLLTAALRMIRKSRGHLMALWFIAGNIIVLCFSAFYAFTFPRYIQVDRSNLWGLIGSLDLNMMRYTIGIHTILAITVIPFVICLFVSIIKTRVADRAAGYGSVLLFVFIIYGLAFNKSEMAYPEFWSINKGDRWSYEWKQLVPLLKNKEHYVPVIFYPVYKQEIVSPGLEAAGDYLFKEQSGIRIGDDAHLHAVVVLNTTCKGNDRPAMLEVFRRGHMISRLKPLYKADPGMRFVYFLNDQAGGSADSIAFINDMRQPALANTFVRVICYK